MLINERTRVVLSDLQASREEVRQLRTLLSNGYSLNAALAYDRAQARVAEMEWNLFKIPAPSYVR